MLQQTIQEQLIKYLKIELDPAFVVLFGSYAKGTNHPDSDIDLAYFSEKQLTSYERFLVANDLAEMTGREVDLIDLKQINPVFMMRIFSQGTPLFIQNENEYIRQKMRAYSLYATLSEQRAVVIEGIKKRGSVFGDE